ncbi:haloacid dehalogenase [Aeropyrum camini]|uniref:Haloacid dehalogenase superfamily protein n=1 Tax=Aeropyrum camini SY1 = JCM 12091 TaxID=1198449 RepID=U3TI03_9CREN|nr:haloacid dehalogenase [Aeropyrum camini]BAN90989.1 haloacid dehalogenase superfamily protein [Aeropyrum camini SY1 = JCM 12091]
MVEWVEPSFDRDKLRSVMARAEAVLSEKDKAREEAIRLARDVVRYSGWAVTAVHKGSLEEARGHLRRAEEAVGSMRRVLEPHPDLMSSGFANNAFSEYVEARLFIDVITGRGLSSPEELVVPIVPYLQGLGDLVGELRRLALELVRRGEFKKAWALLDIMEAIYLELRSLDYPEALLPGVRHKADVARRLVDDTKAMLADLESRSHLEARLKDVLKRLEA